MVILSSTRQVKYDLYNSLRSPTYVSYDDSAMSELLSVRDMAHQVPVPAIAPYAGQIVRASSGALPRCLKASWLTCRISSRRRSPLLYFGEPLLPDADSRQWPSLD